MPVTMTPSVAIKCVLSKSDFLEPDFCQVLLQILTKSLLPLPDKYYGLADVELRHRQRCFLTY